jgi:hypothetical protein
MSPLGKRFDTPRARRQFRDGTRRKTSFVPALVSLESRSLLGVVHPAAELHSHHSARQTIIRGTIHGQYTVSGGYFPPFDGTVTADYSGQGTASHLGHVAYTAQEESILRGTNGSATVMTSKGDTLTIEYGYGFLSITGSETPSGFFLGNMSTGRFAGDSGKFSIQNESFNNRNMTFKETFTVKLTS